MLLRKRFLHSILASAASVGMIVISTNSVSLADAPDNNDASQNAPATVITRQRAQLRRAALQEMSGPQAPRDITNPNGSNRTIFGKAPKRQLMNLCNIHLHNGAEHRGTNFSTYAGNGDGSGYDSGYLYSGKLTPEELKPVSLKRGSEATRLCNLETPLKFTMFTAQRMSSQVRHLHPAYLRKTAIHSSELKQ